MKTSTHQFVDQMLDIGYEEFLPFFDGFSEGLLIVDRIPVRSSTTIPPWPPLTNWTG
jgi:hypothetical protein